MNYQISSQLYLETLYSLYKSDMFGYHYHDRMLVRSLPTIFNRSFPSSLLLSEQWDLEPVPLFDDLRMTLYSFIEKTIWKLTTERKNPKAKPHHSNILYQLWITTTSANERWQTNRTAQVPGRLGRLFAGNFCPSGGSRKRCMWWHVTCVDTNHMYICGLIFYGLAVCSFDEQHLQ